MYDKCTCKLPCPRCRAKAGERCTDPGKEIRSWCHVERAVQKGGPAGGK
jgi:hypothetical protein